MKKANCFRILCLNRVEIKAKNNSICYTLLRRALEEEYLSQKVHKKSARIKINSFSSKAKLEKSKLMTKKPASKRFS